MVTQLIYLHLHIFIDIKKNMEEREITEIILELKSKLKEKYGENFFKFYLCEFSDGSWQGLVSTKESDGYRGGCYYRIKEGIVSEENLSK